MNAEMDISKKQWRSIWGKAALLLLCMFATESNGIESCGDNAGLFVLYCNFLKTISRK